MNFGQNLYNWFLSNAQSLVLMAIAVIGVYLGFKREFSKLIGFLVIALIAVGLVFNASGVKDVLLQLFKHMERGKSHLCNQRLSTPVPAHIQSDGLVRGVAVCGDSLWGATAL